LKGLLKGFKLALRPWESSKNWWRYDWMKFVTQWSGYESTPDEYQWIPATDLDNAAELLSKFYSLYPDKPGPLSQT